MSIHSKRKVSSFRWIIFAMDILIFATVLIVLFAGATLSANSLLTTDKSMSTPIIWFLLTAVGLWNLFSQFAHLLFFIEIPKPIIIIRSVFFFLCLILAAFVLYYGLNHESSPFTNQLVYRISPFVALSYLLLTTIDFLLTLFRRNRHSN